MNMRNVLCALWIAGTVLPAQAQVAVASDGVAVSHVAAKEESAYAPYLLTVFWKQIEHGKVMEDRTYAIAVALETSDGRWRMISRPPSVRDDRHVTYGPAGERQGFDTGTDIDVSDAGWRGSLLAFTLVLSRNRLEADEDDKTNQPLQQSGRYVVSAAVPLGKTVPVFLSSDAASGRVVEIRVLAKPLGQ